MIAANMEGQVRVMLWCVPRCCSTAFTNAISQLENTKMIYEPFAQSYYKGTERAGSRFSNHPVMAHREFSVVRESLEDDFAGYSTVFVKDVAYFIGHHLDRWRDVLPKGYQHTFLIRNPTKTVPSLYKVVTGGAPGFDHFDPVQAEFRSIHDLFFLVKEETGQTPVLVDSNDLLNNPAGMLDLFCAKTGMTFSQSMLSWKKGGIDIVEEDWPGWQSTLKSSTGFLPPSSSVTAGNTEIPEEVKKCIDDNMEYYKKLYQYRITC